MKPEIRTITPTIAKEMLKRNPNNRRLSETHVNFLAKEMTNGNWMFDAQPIRLSESGALLDGQHRLSAIVKSDTQQQFLVIKGVDEEAFKVMDTGKIRSAGDIFSIEGIPNYHTASAATRLIMNIKSGDRSRGDSGATKPSNTDILNYYNEHPEISEFSVKAEELYRRFNRVMPPSQIAGLMYLTHERSVTDSEIFWNKLCTGLDVPTKSPIDFLRRKLFDDKYVNTTKLKQTHKLALIFKTWNHFRSGIEEVKYIRWDKKTEKFPVLK
jgi:hypothetical protein